MMWYGRGFNRVGACFDYFSWGHWMMGGLFLAAAIVIVVLLLKRKKNNESEASTALEQLKLKYVNGEITEEHYLKMKSVLKDQ